VSFDAQTFLTGLFTPETDADPVIGPDDLPPKWREHFEERAAIREHDGGQAREHAEAEALAETLQAMKGAV
jgi:hypothetical protein